MDDQRYIVLPSFISLTGVVSSDVWMPMSSPDELGHVLPALGHLSHLGRHPILLRIRCTRERVVR